MKKRLLAFDFGASSGRAMLGEFDGERIALTEVHRFDNNPVTVRGTFYWDVLALFHEIKQGITKAKALGGFESIGIDTWGVDFGLLDRNGDLMQNPVHYRDARTAGMIEEVCKVIGRDELYRATGNQFMELNTIFQLYALAKKRPELLERASRALLMPDLFGYLLTGRQTAEYSIASTTQLMNPRTHQWDREIMRRLGIPEDLFPDIVKPGAPLGVLSQEIQEELGVGPVKVASVTGHDTACAVVAAPAAEEDFIYISCGTWSLFGTELREPVIGEKSLRYNITNEGGYGYTVRFLKNIIGLWMIQETRRQYRREGEQYSYNDLEKHALAAEPFRFFIDPDAPEFVAPGDIPRRIRAFCKRTGQGEPRTVGEIMRCIYESLALKYRCAFDQIRDCTGKDYHSIHMVGGGTKDNLLCRMAASSTGCRVVAGPIEATALGNIAVQLMAQGDISDVWEARRIISRSFEPAEYLPEDVPAWEAAYARFKQYLLPGG
ncbi:rhamnulokinase family protein [uncultured Anaerotruncus sp.]|uniref:rhamnulokinase n=1 Tax=uncultured Anaerotruncus sp. TaxID=905011 RepID=UPI00280C161B|nr:rhamnulokinase family protein [uncultured Anaerotruncus sp.]